MNAIDDIIAPCGINCSICMAYLRKKNKCNGCRGVNLWNPKTRVECKIKNCNLLKTSDRKFCYECERYPCKLLKHMDVRYKTKYKMSVIDNLENIRKNGVEPFFAADNEKWKCKYCGCVICVHKGICSDCGKEHLF